MPRSRKSAAQWRRENCFLSVTEAAELLGITRQALQVRIQRGMQVAVRAGDGTPIPGAWLIRPEDVQQAAWGNCYLYVAMASTLSHWSARATLRREGIVVGLLAPASSPGPAGGTGTRS